MLPVAPIELAELLLSVGQTDLETFDLAEPTFRLGFGFSKWARNWSHSSAVGVRYSSAGRRAQVAGRRWA
jgi:hypothetical protein